MKIDGISRLGQSRSESALVRMVGSASSRKYFFNILLALASFIIAILACELGLRIFYPQSMNLWSITRDGVSILEPNAAKYPPQFYQEVRTNSLGMRDREHLIEKPAGVFRILLLGDSFMEALQVSFEESFPHLLEGFLGERLTFPVEVISAGVSGWGTDDQLTYLMRYGVKLKPDLVLIAMTLHNDVSDNLSEKFHYMLDGQLYEKPRQEISLTDFVILKAKIALGQNSHLTQLAKRYQNVRKARDAGIRLDAHVTNLLMTEPSYDIQVGWDMTHQLLAKTKTVAEASGAKMVICLLPLWMQVSGERLANFAKSQGLDLAEIRLEQPQQVMSEWGDRTGTEIIDLLPGFRQSMKNGQRDLVLGVDEHWNEAGHRLAASIVAEDLVRRGLVTKTPITSPLTN
ncbi:MAG: SGNH/GDSL hydrolase family protein [Nitrospiraceae bacterium]